MIALFPVRLLPLDSAVVESGPEPGQLSHSGLSHNAVSHWSLTKAHDWFLVLGFAYLSSMRRLAACALPFARSTERVAFLTAFLRVSNAGAVMHWTHTEFCFDMCEG